MHQVLTVFLAWQDNASRRWYPIGRLRFLPSPEPRFQFNYTKGFALAQQEAQLAPLVGFHDPKQVYEAQELFPQFRNRIMHSSREDFDAYVARLDLEEASGPRELSILARSGGRRTTDSFEVFSSPLRESVEGPLFDAVFFVHGARYVSGAVELTHSLAPGHRLRLVADWQNSVDPKALMLRTDSSEGCALLGWVPRYYCTDLLFLKEQSVEIDVVVQRVNLPPAPIQQTVLCRARALWPAGARMPFGSPEYEPL
jgi:hypothetical protein